MIAAFNEPLSRKLNALPGFGWFFDLKPWVGALVLLAFSPIAMWIIDILIVRGYVVPLSYQWLSALFDSVLAVACGLLLWQMRVVLLIPESLRWRWVQLAIVLLWFGLSALHVLRESGSITSWERRLGPNALYHNLFLVPAIGYVLTTMFLVAARNMLIAPVRPHIMVAFVITVICIIAWIWAGTYDGVHQFAPNGVSKHEYANPEHPWTGGLIPQFFRWVWLRLF